MDEVWIKKQWNGVLDLVYPRWCAGCGAWDEDLCAACQGEFSGWEDISERLPYLSVVGDDAHAAFPVSALASYTGAAATAIVTWKNVADRRLDRAFFELISRHPPPDLPVSLVVPAPSNPARSRQGRFVAGVIAEAVAGLYGAEVANVLRRPRTIKLPRAVAGVVRPASMRAREQKARSIGIADVDLRGQDVVVVDDVVTTGATLAGASRAVKSRGGAVRGAFVLAAAKDPRQLRVVSHTAP